MAVKIKFDSNYNPIQPTLVLAHRDGRLIGELPAYNVHLSDTLTDGSTLSFQVDKFDNGEVYPYWDDLQDFKLLWCREWNTLFEINIELDDNDSITKSVTATSLGEAELSQINLYGIEINTDEDIDLDDYVSTVLWNSENPKGSLLHRISEKIPHYEYKHVDSSIANLWREFTFDNTSIKDAFSDISEEMNCLFVIKCFLDEDGSIGKSVASTTNYYLASSVSGGVDVSADGWTTTIPVTSNDEKYLWNYEVTKYTDGTTANTSTPAIIGGYGADGESGIGYKANLLTGTATTHNIVGQAKTNQCTVIANLECGYITNLESGVQYTISCDITANAEGGTATLQWDDSPWGFGFPSTTLKDGTTHAKKTFTYTKKDTDKATNIQMCMDNVPATTTVTVSKLMLVKGSQEAEWSPAASELTDNNVNNIVNYYAASSSSNTVPTSWQTTVPETTTASKYLWSYKVITYTAGNQVSTTPTVIGTHDNTPGIKRWIYVYDLECSCANNSCSYFVQNSRRYRDDYMTTCPKCGSTNITNGYGNDTTIFICRDNLAQNINYSTDVDSVKNCFYLEAGDDLMTATVRSCNPNGSNYIWYIPEETRKDMSSGLQAKLEAYDNLYQSYDDNYSIFSDSSLTSKIEAFNALVDKYQEVVETLNLSTELSKIDTTVKGYANLTLAYYNTVEMYTFLESALMPVPALPETTAQIEANKLTRAALSGIGVADQKSVTASGAKNAIVSMAESLIDCRYSVKASDYTFNKDTLAWSGTLTVKAKYIEDDDEDEYVEHVAYESITFTANNPIYVNGDYETYIKQKLETLIAQHDTVEVWYTKLFECEISYDEQNNAYSGEFCTQLTYYCYDTLKMFYDVAEGLLSVMQEAGYADTSSEMYTTFYLPYYYKQQAISLEMQIRYDEIGLDETDGIVYSLQEDLIRIRNGINNELNFQKYIGDYWSEFCSYRRDDTYSNSNYISDSLTDPQLIKRAMEFLETARKEIIKSATLQHSLNSTLNNLLVMEEFKPLVDYFANGNWMRIQEDGEIYKLRLVSYDLNFDDVTSLDVDFTDVLRTADGISDVASILEKASSMSSSYDYVERQASKAEDTADTINHWLDDSFDATNMLFTNNAERQDQVWNENGMLFRKYDPISESYSPTQMKIINSTLAITTDNWKTLSVAIGQIAYTDPESGENVTDYGVIAKKIIGKQILGTDFGIYNANGTLKFDESGLLIESGTTSDAVAVSITPNSTSLMSIVKDGNSIFSVDNKGNLSITGEINATSGSIGGWNISDGQLCNSTITSGDSGNIGMSFAKDFTRSINGTNRALRFAIGNKFGVTSDGTLYANSAVLSNITASNINVTSGTFNGTVYASGGSFTGAVTATSGSFTGSIYADSGRFGGSLDAATGTFSGSLTAATGTFNGSVIAKSGNTTFSVVPNATNIVTITNGSNTIFKVDSSGNLSVTGDINATSGKFGSLQIGAFTNNSNKSFTRLFLQNENSINGLYPYLYLEDDAFIELGYTDELLSEMEIKYSSYITTELLTISYRGLMYSPDNASSFSSGTSGGEENDLESMSNMGYLLYAFDSSGKNLGINANGNGRFKRVYTNDIRNPYGAVSGNNYTKDTAIKIRAAVKSYGDMFIRSRSVLSGSLSGKTLTVYVSDLDWSE